MEFKEVIVNDMRLAMKSGDTRTRDTLRVLLGDIDRNQVTSKEDIEPIIKSMIKGLNEIDGDTSKAEIDVLNNYMPQLMGDGDILFVIDELIRDNENINMGIIMKHFKDNYLNQYDGKQLSMIVKERLK